VQRIVDPYDPHPRVTDRASLFDVDVTGRSVLCISTLEHIGLGDYNQAADPTGVERTLAHLANAKHLLLTTPFGFNSAVDSLLFTQSPPMPTRYLARDSKGNSWKEVSASEARRSPGISDPTSTSWANGLAIIEF
jgi:hypothetical protein